MATLTIRLPDDKHQRLKNLARHRRISINKLMEELSTRALTEFDSELRFRKLAEQGDPAKGIDLLNRLDDHFSQGG